MEGNGVMLNAYPDSIGDNLSDTLKILALPAFKDLFSLFYVLPTFFNSDLDRGFSIIDYDLNKELVSENDLKGIKELAIDLKFDIVLNHLSVASPQFKDLLAHGEASKYKDFFINWNTFWKGHGTMNNDGIIIPQKDFLDKLFMRKAGLPILKVQFPDGSEQPYWNTFYQKVSFSKTESQKTYLGQMDVNAESPMVWDFYEKVLTKLKGYGCKILRLDAFAYLHKAVGASNFFNTPGTWYYLDRINKMAEKHHITLLPEIHAEYGSGLHKEVAEKGYMIYDFFLPGLLIHALEFKTNEPLLQWTKEILDHGYKTVNMLGCHDGIPVLDLKGKEINGDYHEGLLSDEAIEAVMDIVIGRGGKVKNLYGPNGEKISYYQVNATFFSALGENEKKLLLARAIQLFMPGTPQIWYLDLFAGTNDYDAVQRAGEGGHKDINRTNLTLSAIESRLQKPIVQKQLDLIRLRNTSKAFLGNLTIVEKETHTIDLRWDYEQHFAQLSADLNAASFVISYSKDGEALELYS
ncbi:MAG: alpha-amylase family glycosyl hydrolase [Bacteroidota bacterium]